mmetsp:Transcript_81138/g.161387  ORF Transcript_81138/g.161387 Transcript_81138/m.161387 type:complete len:327 (+) Transcript_81138:179-1159(+)
MRRSIQAAKQLCMSRSASPARSGQSRRATTVCYWPCTLLRASESKLSEWMQRQGTQHREVQCSLMRWQQAARRPTKTTTLISLPPSVRRSRQRPLFRPPPRRLLPAVVLSLLSSWKPTIHKRQLGISWPTVSIQPHKLQWLLQRMVVLPRTTASGAWRLHVTSLVGCARRTGHRCDSETLLKWPALEQMMATNRADFSTCWRMAVGTSKPCLPAHRWQPSPRSRACCSCDAAASLLRLLMHVTPVRRRRRTYSYAQLRGCGCYFTWGMGLPRNATRRRLQAICTVEAWHPRRRYGCNSCEQRVQDVLSRARVRTGSREQRTQSAEQ